MKTFFRDVFKFTGLIFWGAWLTAFIGIVTPEFAEWPIVPVFFLSIIAGLWKTKGSFYAARFLAPILGSLSIQVLLWIV